METNQIQLPPCITKIIESCPVCGAELENIGITEDNNLILIDFENYTLTPVFCTDIGLFMLEEDPNNSLCDHVIFHHTHE